MTKNELKKLIKPIVNECIRESLYESGMLSSIISEVVQGVVSGTDKKIVETREREATHQLQEAKNTNAESEHKRAQLKAQKEKLLNAIGTSAYNGVNVFEGTTPLDKGGSPSSPSTGGHGPLSGIAPNDAGVNIDALTNSLGGVWKKLAEGKKK